MISYFVHLITLSVHSNLSGLPRQRLIADLLGLGLFGTIAFSEQTGGRW